MPGFDERKQVTTRKDHKCMGCVEVIPKGSKAIFHKGKYDEEFYRYHLHIECHQYMVKKKSYLDSGVWENCVNDIKKEEEAATEWLN